MVLKSKEISLYNELMRDILFYTILGYLSGSILFAQIGSRFLKQKDPTCLAPDHNPGAFNAFRYNGFFWGTFTLIGDLIKGFLPVWWYIHQGLDPSFLERGLPFVMGAPVLGHIYPLFFRFYGGEGITTTFGVLLALWIGGLSPAPVWSLVALFLGFKLFLKIQPNYYLTIWVYLALPLVLIVQQISIYMWIGSVLISSTVLIKMLFLMPKPKEKMEVKFLSWKL